MLTAIPGIFGMIASPTTRQRSHPIEDLSPGPPARWVTEEDRTATARDDALTSLPASLHPNTPNPGRGTS